jgi:hypothetical protein
VGIESDQLVYDYLSRVGDLAQQHQLPSGDRMRLVTGLRGEIDRQRSQAVTDSEASVRRILGRLGTPDEVVAAAADGGTAPPAAPPPPAAGPPPAPAPAQDGSAPGGGFGPKLPGQRLWRRVPRPRQDRRPKPPETAGPPPGRPPHLAGLDELGASGGREGLDGFGGFDGVEAGAGGGVDWWRVEPRPYGAGERVGGFTGGVEIPEILHPPRPPGKDDGTGETGTAGKTAGAAKSGDTATPGAGSGKDADGGTEEAAGESAPKGLLPRLLARRAPAAEAAPAETAAAGPVFASPFLLVPAALLVGGAVTGSWIALGLGWLFAYGSRKLDPFQTKLAVLWIPGGALAAGLVWLWGRFDGRWGEPLAQEGMGGAIGSGWPWALKGAALASALYLVWRARRP